MAFGDKGRLLRLLTSVAYLTESGTRGAGYALGPLGTAVREKLSAEWRRAAAVACRSDLKDVGQVRLAASKTLPFGFFAYGRRADEANRGLSSSCPVENFGAGGSSSNLLWFAPPKQADKWFEFWQLHRKFVWRKFLTKPSNVEVTPPTSDGDTEVIEFRASSTLPGGSDVDAKLPWVLEKLCLYPGLRGDEVDDPDIQERLAAIRSPFKVVKSTVAVDEAVLFFLLDSARRRREPEVIRNKDNPSPEPNNVCSEEDFVLCLHRILAPYQLSVYSADLGKAEDFAEALRLDLEDQGFKFLSASGVRTKSETEHCSICDARGVPLVIFTDADSASTGKLGLRSRETTLKEQVHVTRILPKLRSFFESPEENR